MTHIQWIRNYRRRQRTILGVYIDLVSTPLAENFHFVFPRTGVRESAECHEIMNTGEGEGGRGNGGKGRGEEARRDFSRAGEKSVVFRPFEAKGETTRF